MRLSIIRGGGIAGVSALTELDESALSADDAKAFRAKVAEAEAGLGAADAAAGGRQPDELSYEVRLEDGQNTRTVRVGETTLPETVRSLIAWVDAHPKRTTRVLPPSAG
jgi:hypothetical protein